MSNIKVNSTETSTVKGNVIFMQAAVYRSSLEYMIHAFYYRGFKKWKFITFNVLKVSFYF